MLNINKLYELSQRLKLIFILVAIAIVSVSTLFTNRLATSLANEERKKIEIWAEATRQFIVADENTDINYISSIIEGNTSIPVIMTDSNDQMLLSRNIQEPKKNINEFYKQEVAQLKAKRPPIEVKLDNTVQYIYYDDSLFLKQLVYFPYVQFGVIIIFLLVAFFAFSGTKKAEQNQVWVGLSKETAHQLGTPISSLLAWVDLLKLKYTEEKLITDMEKDVNRLRIIAERFSKIGSKPDLQLVSLNETLRNAVQYMANRTSQKVSIKCHFENDDDIFIRLNIPLFEWVIENLCKNAIDAMDGVGFIDINTTQKTEEVYIDVKDTGKGMDKRKFKMVFTPGFTTKKRGWGLGLSLAKRIIEEYHGGKIFVKQSEINSGTVFRIVLKTGPGR
ncbi:MAG TPA: HAMP domain-containing sensor histidine kinase [Paludibacter sp.]|nr:HAMP domain-containing sensor histidine kinase [Paludibacter sp.]